MSSRVGRREGSPAVANFELAYALAWEKVMISVIRRAAEFFQRDTLGELWLQTNRTDAREENSHLDK